MKNTYMYAITLAIAGTVGACSNPVVSDFNVPTSFPHNEAGVASGFTGVINSTRVDAGAWAVWSNAFGRDITYFTPSEPRYRTELLGNHAIQDDDFIGGTIWDGLFRAIKTADTVIAVIPTLLSSTGTALPANQKEALFGTLEVSKYLNYMYLAEAHDSLGVPINQVGGSTTGGHYAPILCNELVWRQLVAMLDSAQDSLAAAGASTPIGLTFPPGFSTVGNSTGAMSSFVLALRAKARVQYAWAIARQNGRGATATQPAVPDASQLDSALLDIQAVQKAGILWTPLTASMASPINDVQVSHSFSTSSGDQTNPIFGDATAYFVLYDALSEIDTTDARFTAKFVDAGAGPSAPPAGMIGSPWIVSYLNATTPLPIVRGLELRFLLAQIYIGMGQYANAATVVDSVRTIVGGLSDGLAGPYTTNGYGPGGPGGTRTWSVTSTDYVSVRDFFLREQRVTFLGEGTADRDMALRDFGVAAIKDTTWTATAGVDYQGAQALGSSTDLHTTLIPISASESDPRGGNLTPVCEGAPALVVGSKPSVSRYSRP